MPSQATNDLNIYIPCRPRLLSALEDKLQEAQGAYDSFVEARTVLGDTERTHENPGGKPAR